MIGNARIT